MGNRVNTCPEFSQLQIPEILVFTFEKNDRAQAALNADRQDVQTYHVRGSLHSELVAAEIKSENER